MRILLGYAFDGGSYPDALGNDEAVFGKVVVGPMGLLSILETRLGLSGPSAHPAVRIGQYMARLRAADDGGRFYSHSFKADAWATANTLLEWRDELVFGGWDGQPVSGVSQRMGELADVENLPEQEDLPRLSPGLGERFRAVCRAVESMSGEPLAAPDSQIPPDATGLGITELVLAEPETFWPAPWQHLFTLLRRIGVNGMAAPGTQAFAHGDLGLLQRCLQDQTAPRGAVTGDQTLVLLTGDTEAEAAEGLAEWLAAAPAGNTSGNRDVLLIRGAGSRILDEALHRRGLPRLGCDLGSRWRAALQVLVLALRNLWRPASPQLLLELLTLPHSPIPHWAGRHFENALREHPGVGGELWQQAWEKALVEMRQRLDKEELPPAKAAQKYKRFEALLQSWLGGERFAPEDGVPAESVKKICSEVASWAAKKNSFRGQDPHGFDQKDPLLFTAQAQAMELEQAVTASGLNRISRPQLNRMLDEVLRFGGASPDSGAEAASWNCVDSAGQVHDSARTIIWWGFVDPAASHGAHTWTRPEREALTEAGVFLEDGAQERIRQARLWRRPVMQASQRLVLVMPTSQAAQATNPHPLWDEISQAVLKEPGAAPRITVHAGQLRRRSELTVAGRTLERQAVQALPLPEAQPEWRIPVDRAAFRATESASSLEKLLGCPLAWVFTYLARIRMGALLALQDKSRLAGILAHAVIERLFQESTEWEPDQARQRAREIYARLLPEMGAELLQPGRDVERHNNADIIGNAVAALVLLLREARLGVVATEQEHQRPHPELGTQIQGVLDLVLRDADDHPVILDMKWTRNAKYRRAEIQEGRSVQLATYSWLLSAPGAHIPAGAHTPRAAYYMLVQGQLLTADVSCFPGQNALNGPGLDLVWENVVAGSNQAMDTLKQGLAAAPGADPESEAKNAPCGFCDYGNLCGASREEK